MRDFAEAKGYWMAQTSRGEPRSVPDRVGEQYDAMLRREQLKRERAEAAANAPPWPGPEAFSLSGLLGTLRRAPRAGSTVTIGGRTYREVDNGHANVLVPIEDPSVSPAELAQRRQAVERAFFLADHPLAGAAYGVAALTNASPHVRDVALTAGGLVDMAMLGAAPFGASVRSPVRAPPRQPAWPTARRPGIRYGELNGNGQATGVTATLTTPMLGTGTKAYWRRNPPGWQGQGNVHNQARAHLLAAQLGGSGKNMRNLVTLTNRGANSPQMRRFEDGVADRVRKGEVVEYMAKPLYREGAPPPSAILLTAHGSRGAPVAGIIPNPAARRK